jgi:pre-mRNA-splicing factor SYF1
VAIHPIPFQGKAEGKCRRPLSIGSCCKVIDTLLFLQLRNILFERALASLPGSYKLWHAYLKDRVSQVAGRCVADPKLEVVNNTFERALVFMHKMPVIWAEYCAFLTEQRRVTRTRRTFDRALQSLPITQHERIWPLYLNFVRDTGVWETCVRVYRRYLQFDLSGREEYVEYLLHIGHWDEAAFQLSLMVNDEAFVSAKGTTKHAVWMQLCNIVSEHPRSITLLRVEPVLRSGIRKFTDEVGRLWCALAEYFVRSGQFEKARDIYEEACNDVTTVRDFATVFDAYSQFEEAMLTAKLELSGPDVQKDASAEAVDVHSVCGMITSAADLDDLSDFGVQGDDLDLRMVRLEMLMDKRPLMLSSVLLRQNPHNVHQWRKRCQILIACKAAPARVVTTYSEAVRTVDPWKAVGKPHELWVDFAKFYESRGDPNAKDVFLQASKAQFKSVEDLAAVWCEWAEMELRQGHYQEALRIMEEATREYRTGRMAPAQDDSAGESSKDSQRWKLYRNLRCWNFYLDLEESLGNVGTTTAAYDRAIQLKVVTPAMILNFANYLEERHYFEEAFRAYERGIAVFPWPHVADIWIAYLTKFVARYGGTKVERCRDLFEQAAEGVPPSHAPVIFKLFADMEEQYGLVRHAMSVYERATAAVDDSHRYEAFLTYIRKAEEYYGAPKTRSIYQKAIEVLPEAQIKDMCLRFANMEATLGENDRARAIYQHAAQYCDPRTATTFWSAWQAFEVKNGTEDTFRDMLRVQRSVAAQFSTGNQVIAELLANAEASAAVQPRNRAGESPATLEAPQQTIPGGEANAYVGALERFKAKREPAS